MSCIFFTHISKGDYRLSCGDQLGAAASRVRAMRRVPKGGGSQSQTEQQQKYGPL